MNKDSKIYIAGNTGLVGSAITRNLISKGYTNLVFTPHAEYDLSNQEEVKNFFYKEKPEYVFLAAAKVGGIVANNTYRGDFIYLNLAIQNNIIHYSYETGVKKLMFMGSSCIYPKNCPQPMTEDHLLTSELEYTNEPYAIAKIAGIKICESYNLQYGTNYISVMPTNLYGPNDNYDLEKSHVLPALIRKMHLGQCLCENNLEAIKQDINKRPIEGVTGAASEELIYEKLAKYGITKDSFENVTVELWGSGSPRREFLHSNDLADASVFLMEKIDFANILEKDFGITKPSFPLTYREVRNTHINIGTGKDLTIKELAQLVSSVIGFEGTIKWNTSKPDGTYQKLLNVNKLKELGWVASIEMEDALKEIYKQYKG